MNSFLVKLLQQGVKTDSFGHFFIQRWTSINFNRMKDPIRIISHSYFMYMTKTGQFFKNSFCDLRKDKNILEKLKLKYIKNLPT
jgi:hypothetical protein